MKFCESLDEFIDCYHLFTQWWGIKPVLYEKNKCIVAALPKDIDVTKYAIKPDQLEQFALPFYCVDMDANRKGIDISSWN